MSIPIFPCCSWKNHDKSLWNPGFGGFFIPFFRPKKAEFSITRDPAQVVSGTSPINAHGTECFSSNGGISESGPAGKPSDGWLNVDNGDDLDVHGWLNVDNVDNGDWIILVMFLLLGIWLLFIFLQGRFWTASSRFFWWSGDRFLVSWGFDLSKLLWSIVEYSLWSFYSHVRHVSHVCICGQLRLMMTVFQLSRAWIHMKSVHSPCWKSDRSKIVLCAVLRAMVSRLPRGIWATDRRRQGTF